MPADAGIAVAGVTVSGSSGQGSTVPRRRRSRAAVGRRSQARRGARRIGTFRQPGGERDCDDLMKFHLLGPLEIRSSNGELLDISQPMHRAVLAVLLLRPGRSCSQALLAEVLWGDDAPRDPGSAIRTCVYGVRRQLGQARGRLRTG